MEPTGKKRYRVLTRFGRPPVLVLQWEMEIDSDYCGGGVIDTEIIKVWTDAQPEWLLEDRD